MQTISQFVAEIGVEVASAETEVGLLSGGQRQAIATLSNAYILLLDEPLAAMGRARRSASSGSQSGCGRAATSRS